MSAMNAVKQKKPPRRSPKRGGAVYGERLKRARQALGYETAADFAERLDIHPGTYRNYERGDREMSYEDMQKVAAEGVSIQYLVLGIAPAIIPALRENA